MKRGKLFSFLDRLAGLDRAVVTTPPIPLPPPPKEGASGPSCVSVWGATGPSHGTITRSSYTVDLAACADEFRHLEMLKRMEADAATTIADRYAAMADACRLATKQPAPDGGATECKP